MTDIGNDQEIWEFINDSRSLHNISLTISKKLVNFHLDNTIDYEVMQEIVSELKQVTNMYKQMVESNVEIYKKIRTAFEYNLRNYNYDVWMRRNQLQYDSLLHCVRIVIHKLLKFYKESILQVAIQLISFYNYLVSLELSVNVDAVFAHSSKSIIVQNRKKFTMSRVLKILSSNRTEECAQYLTQFLIKKFEEMDKVDYSSTEEDGEERRSIDNNSSSISDNTSIFVFKTLTQYVCPQKNQVPYAENHEGAKVVQQPDTNTTNLVINERRKLSLFFSALLSQPGDLLREDETMISKKLGKRKLKPPAKEKIIEIYEHTLWQNVGIISEHMLLWWLDKSLGKKNPLTSQKFNAWLKQYHKSDLFHSVLRPTINSLIDCLCCHITSTSWDELFRKALISAGYQHSRHELQDIGLGTKTGHLFSDVLYDVVFLTNNCEGSNWTVQDIENLPISEQIPLLHRLDHSIHMVRLWALSRAKYLAHSWNMEQFFRVTHVDVNASLYALTQLKLTQNVQLPSKKETPHFTVCIKMRAKLISEVNVNIDKLREVPKESLSILASVCMITSLAYLKICFPKATYWQQKEDEKPRIVSDYVDKYLDEILKPVLLASQNLTGPAQKSVNKIALEILCEAWLDHIYKYRIKFSERGAIQLLVDFAAIPVWLQEKVDIAEDIRQLLKTSEILRRCEGVGRLLLRQPGECIVMNSKKNNSEENDESENTETLMPPEMYVPNQEKWLKLRLNKQKPSVVCCK